ncbi:MAG: hypothetical protein AAFV85_10110 [Cyanobacteria bacterium J06634_6]
MDFERTWRDARLFFGQASIAPKHGDCHSLGAMQTACAYSKGT